MSVGNWLFSINRLGRGEQSLLCGPLERVDPPAANRDELLRDDNSRAEVDWDLVGIG